jgi:hypothetical protein
VKRTSGLAASIPGCPPNRGVVTPSGAATLIGASAVNLKARQVLTWCVLAAATTLCALGSLKAAEGKHHVAFSTDAAQSDGNRVPAGSLALGVTAAVADPLQGRSRQTSRAGLISTALPSAIPRVGNGSPLLRASLAFTVSVCLADVEYSIACWERGLLEATKRLEQIYLDDFTTRKVAGSLKIWFPLVTDRNEQLRFLREAEERSIKNAVVKLQAESDRQINTPTNPLDPNSLTTSAQEGDETNNLGRQRVQQLLQKWREDASMEARRGTNWSHDWSSRTHSYQLGQALHNLVQIASRARSAR